MTGRLAIVGLGPGAPELPLDHPNIRGSRYYH